MRARRSRRPVVVGLTGGVSSGKSTVAAILGRLGAMVVDADRLAHEALDLPRVRRALRERWGEDVFDHSGSPDRRRIARIVFRDPDALAALVSVVHPPVIRKIRSILREAARESRWPMVVIDAPLLVESALDRHCDAIVFVHASQRRRAERARSARGWSLAEIRRREALQRPLEEKRRKAHYILDNNNGRSRLRAAVARLFYQLTGASGTPDGPIPSRR